MKKIMFNDRYGLTDAVLSGRKTMTRRIVPEGIMRMARMEVNILGGDIAERIKDHTPLCYLEEIAIAQPYKTLIEQGYLADDRKDGWVNENYITSPGYSNKMFVAAKYMPHRIRITDIKAERLQDISVEDAMREGIYKHNALPDALGEDRYKFISYAYDATQDKHRRRKWFPTPREAFAALIDKVSGKGTWNLNPWVFVYEFELTKL